MPPRDLSKIRAKLDGIDRRILDAVADRHDIIQDVAELKADSGAKLRDVLREKSLDGELSPLSMPGIFGEESPLSRLGVARGVHGPRGSESRRR